MPHQTITEEEIIDGIRARKDKVFNHLHEHCFDAIRIHVSKNSGSDEDAQDNYNEGILALIEFIDNPKLKMSSSVSTIFISICVNKWYTVLEKRRSKQNYRYRHSESTTEEFNIDDTLDHQVHMKILKECFNKLGKDCQNIYRGYFEEMTCEEIAKLLGYSPGYVKKKKCNCKDQLLEFISKHPDYKKMIKSNEVSNIEILKK